MPAHKVDPLKRFWSKVDKSGDCWLWTAGKFGAGYGAFSPTADKAVGAHVFSWELANKRPVPRGMCVCHVCDVRACVRPDHLFLGTDKENSDDAKSKGRLRNGETPKTHCPQGHPYSGTNLRMYRGHRYCRTCVNGFKTRQRWARLANTKAT